MIEHFNRRSQNYEDSRDQRLWFDGMQKRVLKLASKLEVEHAPSAILDVGCGTGRLLRKAKEIWPNAQFIGIDAAQGMIEKAKQLMPTAKFYVSPAESLPLPDHSVALSFSTASYNFWQNKQKALKEINRVLKPNSLFFLADFWPPLGLSRFMTRLKENNPQLLHENLQQAGFKVRIQKTSIRYWAVIIVGQSTEDSLS